MPIKLLDFERILLVYGAHHRAVLKLRKCAAHSQPPTETPLQHCSHEVTASA
jgi:hypothetical protein